MTTDHATSFKFQVRKKLKSACVKKAQVLQDTVDALLLCGDELAAWPIYRPGLKFRFFSGGREWCGSSSSHVCHGGL